MTTQCYQTPQKDMDQTTSNFIPKVSHKIFIDLNTKIIRDRTRNLCDNDKCRDCMCLSLISLHKEVVFLKDISKSLHLLD